MAQHEFDDYEISLPLVIDYTYSHGTPPTSSWNCPMGEPGDPPECLVNQVLVMLPREQIEKALKESKGPMVGIDIVSVLGEGIFDKLEEEMFEIGKEAYFDEQKEWDDDRE